MKTMFTLFKGRKFIKMAAKLLLGGGAGWLISELLPNILSAVKLITPEGIANSDFLQGIFTQAKNLFGGTISFQPIIQGAMTLLGALGPTGSNILSWIKDKTKK